MNRFDKAVAFLSRFVFVRLYEIDTEETNKLAEVGLPVKGKGFYLPGTIYIKTTSKTEEELIKTLLHEFGHHLVFNNLLQKEDIPEQYFLLVNQKWLSTYFDDEKEEEELVESFALWGMDSTSGLNPEFWNCLREKLKQL